MKKINSIFLELKESMDKSKFETFLQKKIQQFEEDISENDNENTTFDENIFNDLDFNIEKIIKNTEECLEFVNFYLEPKGFIKSILNYLFNDSFGSLFELRQRLMSVFNCKEEFLISKDNYKLET